MNELETQVMETEVISDEQPAGAWHYIRAFCAFFAIITSFAPIIVMTEMRTHFLGFAGVLWVLGIISALLVSPLKFLKFGWNILSRCAIFGWFLLPFPFDLVTVAVSIAVGILGAVLALIVCPAIFTIYTYFTDIRYYCVNNKKEFIAIGSAIAIVLVSIGLFFAMHGITTAIEAPMVKNKFDAVSCYNTYSEENTDVKQLSEDILSNPKSSEFSEGGYVCTNVYEYEGKEGFVNFTYRETIKFEYLNNIWKVIDIDETKEAGTVDTINGTWKGTGYYPANFASNNEFIFNIKNLTESGGTGALSVYLEGTTDDHSDFTIEMGELETQVLDPVTQETEVVANLTLILDSPLTCDNFVSQTFSEVECEFSLTENEIRTYTFDVGGVILEYQ